MTFILRHIYKLKERLTTRQFEVFVAILVGILAGVMAVILKSSVHLIHKLIHIDRFFSVERPFYMIFFPLLGIFITVFFVQKALKGDLGKGVSGILYEIAKKSAFVKRHKIYSHVVTSALTVGFGGSAGLEAPIVITGSAVGSNVATSFKLNYRERSLFLGCGAAAGIAAVFNAPIAGVMFAMEVLLSEVTISSFIPLIIAAACGGLFSKMVLNEQTIFLFQLQEPFNYHNTPFYVILALVCGLVSVYYVRISHSISGLFKKSNHNIYIKALIGSLFLVVLVTVFPSLFSEGYHSIRAIADGNARQLIETSLFKKHSQNDWAVLGFIASIALIKPIATSLTLSAGGNGGNFAPSLFVGTYIGFAFARLGNMLFDMRLPESNFTIVGMAGVLSGVMYAPLTGIFLIAEVTGGYDLFLPLMLVSTLSHVVVKHFEPYSLEIKDMIARGEVFSQDKDRNILLLLKTTNLIETDVKTVRPTDSLRLLIEAVKESHRHIFAVVDTEGVLKGTITLDDLRSVMFDTQLYDTLTAAQLMHDPPAVVDIHDDMNRVMKRFDSTQAWNLPVVDRGQYVGFISKSSVFSKYRHQLMSMSGETL